MKKAKQLPFPYDTAICYSGFREGQHPGDKHPSYEQIKEDLLILHGDWKYLRLYDVDDHAKTVIEVIQKEKLDFQVMLGAYIVAEVNNPGCPWGGGTYTDKQLAAQKIQNSKRIDTLIEWANQYPNIINCLSVGNEATVAWTDHMVPVPKVIEYVKRVKANAKQPVTFCENYVPWTNKLKPLAAEVDFISIHTYPVWEYRTIEQGLAYTIDNYKDVADLYPDIPVVITEAGWTTHSNGRGIPPENVNEEFQKQYYHELVDWITREQIITYIFEAFDEPWKGSPDPMEPEKHWGLYKVDRTPKLVMEGSVNAISE
jgi:exo-beta-1,3-glucanase (GH17 family)